MVEPSRLWAVVSCLTLLLTTGCTRNGPFHLDASVPPLPGLTQTSSTPVDSGAVAKRTPKDAPVVTIEFDERGKLFPCSGDVQCEVVRAKKLIENARKERTARHIVVLTFIHGWHHNASERDENLKNFRAMVNCLNLGEDAQIQNRKKGQPILCGGLHADEANYYIGIYIGWRGESVQPWLTEAATALSVVNRHDDAVLVSENTADDGVEHAILELSGAAKGGTDEPARFILIGHSFGGLIAGRISVDLFLRRLQDMPELTPSSPRDVCLEPFADLVVLMNPADSSVRLARLMAELKRKTRCPSSALNSALSRPLLLSLHTSSDSATDALGSWALHHTGFDVDYAAALSSSWEERPDKDNLVDAKQVPAIHTNDLRGNTPNVSPYLRNLCYLDQANYQDSICLGMNDTIHALKQKAWEKAISKTEAPKIKNPNYSPDPYYHGAYELLTAVCTEPWEESRETRGKTRDQKHAFDPDFEAKPCTPANLARRDALRKALKTSLMPYLAFPEPRGPGADLLLDVYARSYTGCYRDFVIADGTDVPPEDCQKDARWHDEQLQPNAVPWNNTAVWELNTSYEIVQSHSGFWNADLASLLVAMASQYKTVPATPVYQGLRPLPPLTGGQRVPAVSVPPRAAKQQRNQQQQQQQRR